MFGRVQSLLRKEPSLTKQQNYNNDDEKESNSAAANPDGTAQNWCK